CAGLHPENNNQDFTSSNPAGYPSQCSLLFYGHHRSPAFLQFALQNNQLSNTITGFSKMTHFAPGHNFGQLTRKVCWQAFGILMIYIVTLPIFPGFVAKNMEFKLIRDFSIKKASQSCISRLLFYPVFTACLHGPEWLEDEVLVAVARFMLSHTKGYLTNVLMILGPKSLPVSEAELSAIVLVVFLGIGLVSGSVLGWFWII
ncbi:hypothetical protein Goklo_005859, partial [Gossypium klotzschianum]|nr:hypothetical protein [Gossypium klotzschianum]